MRLRSRMQLRSAQEKSRDPANAAPGRRPLSAALDSLTQGPLA